MTESERCYYKSCDTLPIYNFYKILNTKDLMWLVKGYEGDEGHDDEDKLIELWEKIYEEYIDLLGEKAISKKAITLNQISKIELELRIVSSLIQIYADKRYEEIGEQIDAWGYYKDDIEKSIKKLEGLKFRMNIMISKTKDDDDEEEKKYDIYKDIVAVENILGNGLTIDPYKTVVSKWVNYILISERKNGKRSDRLSSNGRSS